jgi:FkbM family methyltransferase
MALIRSLDYLGPAVSFEPEREAFAVLAEAARDDPGWDVRRLALAERGGHATLHVSGNSVSSSLLPMRDAHVRAAPASAPVGPQDVLLSTVDAELDGMDGRRVWLKLDVQGMELPVLLGARETLGRTRVVQAELSLRPLYDGQTNHLELMSFLAAEGFVAVHLLPGFRDRETKHLLQFDALFVSGVA